MKIDEAIAHAKEQTEIFGGSHKEFLDNVAEWLEELKALREKTYDKGYVQGTIDRAEEVTMARVHGYNKAIDDFEKKLYERCDSMINNEWNKGVAPISWANAYADFKDDVEEIAEQLKAGDTDGNSTTDN